MDLVKRAAGGLARRVKTVRERAQRYAFSPQVRRTWAQVRANNLTYSREDQLHQILRLVQATSSSGAMIIEAGCARGGSAILMCAAKNVRQKLRVYDVFDMLPPPSEHDGEDMRVRYEEIASGRAVGLDGGLYYLYEPDLKKVVEGNFRQLGFPIEQHNVELIKGKAQDTVSVDEPVAFANIDVDWFEPVTACLERIVPNLIPGGAVALRTYHGWSGCRKATDAYFERRGRDSLSFDSSLGHLVVTRLGA